ncbi:hypothetical protein PYCC9005_002064 [Savitreella phatthalungensis]
MSPMVDVDRINHLPFGFTPQQYQQQYQEQQQQQQQPYSHYQDLPHHNRYHQQQPGNQSPEPYGKAPAQALAPTAVPSLPRSVTNSTPPSTATETTASSSQASPHTDSVPLDYDYVSCGMPPSITSSRVSPAAQAAENASGKLTAHGIALPLQSLRQEPTSVISPPIPIPPTVAPKRAIDRSASVPAVRLRQNVGLGMGKWFAEEEAAREAERQRIDSVYGRTARFASLPSRPRPSSFAGETARRRQSSYYPAVTEAAGFDPEADPGRDALEDYDGLQNADVDRYGFIKRPTQTSHPSPKRSGIKRSRTWSKAMRRASAHISADFEASDRRKSNYRVADQAELAEAVEEEAEHIVVSDKEASRALKWRDMAVPIYLAAPKGCSTMLFDFHITSKLVSRTYKGIPDCWRAAAWRAFLRHSAIARGRSPRESALCVSYRELLSRTPFRTSIDGSPADDTLRPPRIAGLDEDVSRQIELDVPRTIGDHVLFRRRHRGGQALLSRVLHCLAAYFPSTGYVQGMASLAATLLCYYTEEEAFVLLCWLWTERGVATLYQPGFACLTGLHERLALRMRKEGGILKRLVDAGVHPAAFATRWYLTWFHGSVPFRTQLRLWDVLLLIAPSSNPRARQFNVLEAASLALIRTQTAPLIAAGNGNIDFDTAMHHLTKPLALVDDDQLMSYVRRYL